MKQIMASKMGEPLEGSIASRRSEAPPSQAKLLEAQAKILALGKKLLDVKKEQPGGETQEPQEIEMRREAERRRLGQGSLHASLTQRRPASPRGPASPSVAQRRPEAVHRTHPGAVQRRPAPTRR